MNTKKKLFICLIAALSLFCNTSTHAYANESTIVSKSTNQFYDDESGETITVVAVLSSSPNNAYKLRALDEYSKVWTSQISFYKGTTSSVYLGSYTVQFNHNYSPQRGYSEITGIVHEGTSVSASGYAIAGSYNIDSKNSIKTTATITNSKGTYSETKNRKYVCYSSGSAKVYE